MAEARQAMANSELLKKHTWGWRKLQTKSHLLHERVLRFLDADSDRMQHRINLKWTSRFPLRTQRRTDVAREKKMSLQTISAAPIL